MGMTNRVRIKKLEQVVAALTQRVAVLEAKEQPKPRTTRKPADAPAE